jgi:hypothetical protein
MHTMHTMIRIPKFQLMTIGCRRFKKLWHVMAWD